MTSLGLLPGCVASCSQGEIPCLLQCQPGPPLTLSHSNRTAACGWHDLYHLVSHLWKLRHKIVLTAVKHYITEPGIVWGCPQRGEGGCWLPTLWDRCLAQWSRLCMDSVSFGNAWFKSLLPLFLPQLLANAQLGRQQDHCHLGGSLAQS